MSQLRNKKCYTFSMILLFLVLFSVLSEQTVNASTTQNNPTKIETEDYCGSGKVDGEFYYYFTTNSNGTVRIGVDNTDLELTLWKNADYSDKITIDDDGYVDLKAGTYYAKVTGTGDYKISVNFEAISDKDKEPNNTMATALPLTSGVSAIGNAYEAFDDVDWYKLDIQTRSEVNFKLVNGNESVFLYDINGRVIDFINGVQTRRIETGTYYIKVTSAMPVGYYELTATITEFPTPNEITNAVYKGSRKVELTWSKSEYADGYYLYYKTSETGKWNLITTIYSGNATTYTHAYGPFEGQTYYYGVQAYRKSPGFGEVCNNDEDDPEGFKVTATSPSINSAQAKNMSGKTIRVSWSVSGTANGYNIYRKSNGGSYQLVKTIGDGSVLSWTDTGVKKGTNYVYKVVPYIVSGSTTNGKQATTSNVKLTGSLAKVTGVKASKKKSYNTVSWKKNSLATGYKVYRKTGSGSYILVKTTSSTSYKDKSVKKGKKYTYKIKAYYKNYTYSAKKKKYTYKTVYSKYSKTISVKR